MEWKIFAYEDPLNAQSQYLILWLSASPCLLMEKNQFILSKIYADIL